MTPEQILFIGACIIYAGRSNSPKFEPQHAIEAATTIANQVMERVPRSVTWLREEEHIQLTGLPKLSSKT